MKRVLVALIASVVLATPCFADTGGRIVKGDPKTLDTLSYCVGVSIGATLKEDKTLAVLDFDVAELSDGFTDQLLGQAKLTYNDAADRLMHFVSVVAPERLIENEAKRVGNPKMQISVFATDVERSAISYAFGLFMAEVVRKPISEFPYEIHCYWLSRGIQDFYANSYVISEAQMLEYLGRAEVRQQQMNRQ